MYKALYRKYRPNNFNDVVGQKSIVMTLQNIVKTQKISHAYLFNGPRGTGKTSIAKIFAKAINCLNPHDGLACDNCKVCTLINEDKVNDIIEIDAASNNGVDEIRDLKSKINLAPSICQYKVYIIDEVHMLSIGAFNALLKTLEEPPHHVVFILATTEMQKLPLTIISRCQNFNFKKITEEQIKERLLYISKSEEVNIEQEALNEIAKASDGGMRDAIGLLEQLYSFTDNNIKYKDVEMLSSSVTRNDIAKLINCTCENKVEEIFNYTDEIYQDGKDFIKVVEDIIVFLKDILLYRKAKNYSLTRLSYDINEYNDLIDNLTEERLYKYIKTFNDSISDLKVSTHPKIIFEIVLLKLLDNKINRVNELVTEQVDKKLSNENTVLQSKSVEKPVADEPIIVKPIVKVEIKTEEVVDNDDDLMPFVKIPMYKKIMINNTLAQANKEILNEIKGKNDMLQTFLINKDFKQAATILLDGKAVGASENNLIYTYQYEGLAEKADGLIGEVTILIEKVMGRKFNIINIKDSDWKEIRPYYINLVKDKKKIEILPEIKADDLTKNVRKKEKNKEIDEAINIFGEDLIEIK